MANKERKIWVKISGTPLNASGQPSDHYRYSGRMGCAYIYVTALSDYTFANTKVDYDDIFSGAISTTARPIVLNYTASSTSTYDITNQYLGLCSVDVDEYSSTGTQGTFYRRQYDKYQKRQWNSDTQSVKITNVEFIGQWEPVAVEIQSGYFRDFNVQSGHSYQYVMYPAWTNQRQIFAKDRSKQDIYAAEDTKSLEGDAIHVDFTEWSLSELVEETNPLTDAPVLKKVYKVDIDNIWFFKYSLDVGSQKQTLTKNQITTLGQYPRIAHGNQNSISGSISCMLGSEIVPYSQDGYTERIWESIEKPFSTNEKILMLKKWRQFVYSKNPKLLKDTKGQSWIVSIIDNSNTPFNSYHNQPDKISFSWVEIESTDKLIIYGDGKDVVRCGGPSSIWESTTK